MIRKVTLRRFKRFDEVTFDIPEHIVLAGPNNTGKTTLLQSVAAWTLAFNRWRQLNDFQRHGVAYTKAPIARQAFSAVPLRAFDLLWNERRYKDPVEVEIESAKGRRDPESVHVMSNYEVPEPILNSAFEEPKEHWNIEEGEVPRRIPGRRRAIYFYRDPQAKPSIDQGQTATDTVSCLSPL